MGWCAREEGERVKSEAKAAASLVCEESLWMRVGGAAVVVRLFCTVC